MTELVDDPWMTIKEVAIRLRMSESGLRTWRETGYGPRSTKNGGRILYRTSEIVAWERALDSQAVGSDPGNAA